MKASLLVIASFGLVAYVAVQWKHSKQLDLARSDELVSSAGGTTESTQPFTQQSSSADPDIEKSVTVVAEVPREVRIDRVIRANLEHVTLDRSIVVFENGTSVLVQEPCRNPVRDARYLLGRCGAAGIKFQTHQVEEGRTIVAFEEGSVYHWIFPEDMAAVGSKALDEVKLLLAPAELSSIQEGWNPPLQARLGLTARKWLATDVADLRVAKILKGSAVVAGDTQVGKVLPAISE